jgi:hypothetical protein
MTTQTRIQPRIVGLARIERKSGYPHWTLTLAGVDEPITVTLTTSAITSFNSVWKRVFIEHDVVLDWMTPREWCRTVDSALGVFVRGEKP